MQTIEPAFWLLSKPPAKRSGLFVLLRITNLPRIEDFLARKDNIGSGETVLIWNGFWPSSFFCFFRLRGVVFVSETALGETFYFESVGLCAMRRHS